jgi:hypothetical protein
MKPEDSIGDVFHLAAGDLISCHLFEAECNAGNPQPVRGIGSKGHGSGSTYDTKGSITGNTVCHTGDSVFVRGYPYIIVIGWFPGVFIAGRYTGIEKRPHFRIDSRSDSKHFIPYTV